MINIATSLSIPSDPHILLFIIVVILILTIIVIDHCFLESFNARNMDSSASFGSFRIGTPSSTPLATNTPAKMIWRQAVVEALLLWIIEHKVRPTDVGYLQARDNRAAAAALNKTFGLSVTASQVKWKLRGLASTWSNWTFHTSHIETRNGDEETEGPRKLQEIEDAHYEVNERCREFRNGAVPKNLQLLEQIFGESRQHDKRILTASQISDEQDEEHTVDAIELMDCQEGEQDDQEGHSDASDAATTSRSRQVSRGRGAVRRRSISSSSSYRSTSRERELARVADQLEEFSRQLALRRMPKKTWISYALEALDSIHEYKDWPLDDRLLVMDYMTKNMAFCEAFATVPENRLLRLQRMVARERLSAAQSSLPPVQENMHASPSQYLWSPADTQQQWR